MSSRRQQKLDARARRLALEERRAAHERRRRSVRTLIASLVAIAAVGGAVAAISATGRGTAPQVPGAFLRQLRPLSVLGRLRPPGPYGPIGPEGVPVPASRPIASGTVSSAAGDVDGISCLGQEQLLFHIHAHLTVFVDGAARQVPAGVGIRNPRPTITPVGTFVGSGSCFYSLHTHSSDGIIHIESPVQRVYTLGDFFDIWHQPLSSGRVGPLEGPVKSIFDGRAYLGNPRDIPLTAHAQIQLEIGTPLVSPVRIAFPSGL